MTTAKIPTPRSGFVTGVAWTFIGLAGFATLIAIMQNVMLSTMFTEELRPPIHETEAVRNMPAIARVMFNHPEVIFRSFLVLSAATLISAIGLLKRKNWARLVFIGIMAVGIVWNLFSIVLPFYMSSSFVPPVPEHAPSDIRDNFELTWKIMAVFTIAIGLAFAGLLGWIIKRLVSHDIKQEFLAR